MNKKIIIFSLILLMVLLTSCHQSTNIKREEMIQPIKDKPTGQLVLQLENEKVPIIVSNTKIVNDMSVYIPFDVTFNELNGNEIYAELPFSIDASPERVKEVKAGDVMLFGSSTLVIFYETHRTDYQYTKIGKVSDISQIDRLRQFLTATITDQ